MFLIHFTLNYNSAESCCVGEKEYKNNKVCSVFKWTIIILNTIYVLIVYFVIGFIFDYFNK